MERTAACRARWSASNSSSALRRASSRYPSTRQRAGVLVGRDGVGLLLVVQLQTVLDRAEEPVRVVEPNRVFARDVVGVGERGERFERVRRAHRLVVAAVHELEELHGELDVADAAAPALELAVGEPLAARDLFRPFLHRAHLAHRLGIEALRPHGAGCGR